jgi:hypothetical protein
MKFPVCVVEEKEKLVTIPEHTDAEVLQCPYPLSEDISMFTTKIVSNYLPYIILF